MGNANYPVGRDFLNFWTAGNLVAEGHVARIFNPGNFTAAQHRLFSPELSFSFWSYPPTTLLAVAPPGSLTYSRALGLWLRSAVALWLVPVAVIPLNRIHAPIAPLLMSGATILLARPGSSKLETVLA